MRCSGSDQVFSEQRDEQQDEAADQRQRAQQLEAGRAHGARHVVEVGGRKIGAFDRDVVNQQAHALGNAQPFRIARPEHGRIARGELVGFDEVILGVARHRGGLRMFEDARMAGHQHDEEQCLLAFFGGD